jgi:hypothetical protein
VREIRFEKYKTGLFLLLLTAGAVLVHGYHPYAEDAEIYLPGVEKILNPRLFPVGREFFQSHARMTLFPNLVAASLRVTHLPLEAGLFLWHVTSIFLLLLACWQLSGILFRSERARWGGVCLIAALLTIPVAATALYIVDQYLNPRNLAAFAVIFAVTRTLEKKYFWAGLWIVFAASVHPMMWTFGFAFCALLVVMEKWEGRKTFSSATKLSAVQAVSGLGCLLPFGISLAPQTSRAYHEAALLHGNHYIQRWEWYEDLGIVAPIALLWWFGRIARERGWRELDRVCRALMIYTVIFFCAALVVDLPPSFESLARLQPLRSLHLLYMVMFVVMGGFLGEFVLKNRMWRWLVLFIPLTAGMFVAQRELFPASAQVEWPGVAPKNPWAQAFLWIRQNTPEDAVFAIDPGYMHVEGEDEIGFRCMAQRSRLADAIKDNGVVSMFPALADEWWGQVQAESSWKTAQTTDFKRLQQKYGVNWVVLQQPAPQGFNCPYENATLRVCRLP